MTGRARIANNLPVPALLDIIPLMRAIVLDEPKKLLRLRDVAKPRPNAGQCWCAFPPAPFAGPISISSMANYPKPKLPLIPGHELSPGREDWPRRENIPRERSRRHSWLGWTWRRCKFADPIAKIFAGVRVLRVIPSTVVRGIRRRRCPLLFSSSESVDNVAAAPLLCAGLIGFALCANAVIQTAWPLRVRAAAHIIVRSQF